MATNFRHADMSPEEFVEDLEKRGDSVWKMVARMMGIPAALMIVETSGASVQYTNVEHALDGFAKATLLPRYLSPIESHLSDLVPRTRTVRFSTDELQRSDVQTRWAIYGAAVRDGLMTVDEIRAAAGMAPLGEQPAVVYQSAPALRAQASAIGASEVPRA